MNTQRLEELEERIESLEMLVRRQPINPDCLYTPAEVATWLRCGKTNVYELMLGGELASTRVGSGKAGKRIRGSDIAAFLDERTDGGPGSRGDFKFLKALNRRAC